MAAVRWWRKWWVWLIAGGVVLLGLAVSGVVAVVSTFQGLVDGVAAEDEARKPFELALDDLARTSAVHYQGPMADGVDYDLSVTKDGDAYGTVGVADATYGVLKIGDAVYLRPPPGTLAGADATNALRKELDGRWIANEGDAALPVDDLVRTPQQYADQLRSALASGGTVGGQVEVEGLPALRADTWAGSIYVTKEAPHEVLYVTRPEEEPSTDGGHAAESLRDRAAGDAATFVTARLAQDEVPPGESAGIDAADGPPAVSALSDDELGTLFDSMDGATRDLTGAVDPGVVLRLNGDGQVSCGSRGCTANVRTSVDVTPSSGTLKGGTVNGQLVATFSVDGRTAGGCSSASALPLKGSAAMGCSAPGAGGVYAAVEAQKKAQAQSRSRACRCSVRYGVPYTVDWQVLALADVRVEVLRSRLGDRRKNLMDQGQFCSFAGTTPVLMGDGTRTPIQDVEIGDEVWSTDPVGGESGPRGVTHVWVHRDEVFELEIDGETVLTTEDHPFWSATDLRFERADELAAGEWLLGADGERLVVDGRVDLAAGRQRVVYNLSVAGLHTYHVGPDALLVHNVHQGPGSPGKGEEGTQRLVRELKLRGYTDIVTEISARAANGVGVRFDVVATKNGNLYLFDSKNGPGAVYTKNQGRRGGYESIETHGGTWYGKNARKAGLSGRFGPSEVLIAGYGGYPFTGRCR